MAMKRAMHGTACTATWPITGKPCANAPRPGHDTCAAHDPDGDQRRVIPDHQRCTATNRESGERCLRYHAPGGKVCAMHGGNAKQVREKAENRTVEARLESLAADLVGKPVANPLTELSRLAGRARAWMEMLEERVQALLDEQDGAPRADSDAGDDDETPARGIRYPHRAGEQIRAEVQLYERAMSQLGTLLTSIARLDIDTRLAKITERQADAVIAALEAGLTAAGIIDAGVRSRAKAAAARELRLVK